jgi:DNA gyrase subunit A
LIDIQTSDRNGPVVAVSKVTEDDEVMLTTSGGMGIRTRVSTMRTIGRNTQGVRLIKLDEGDVVSSLAKLPEDELGDEGALLTPIDSPDSPDDALGQPELLGNGEVSLQTDDELNDGLDPDETEPGDDPDSGPEEVE